MATTYRRLSLLNASDDHARWEDEPTRFCLDCDREEHACTCGPELVRIAPPSTPSRLLVSLAMEKARRDEREPS
jgi:hypothetical protein